MKLLRLNLRSDFRTFSLALCLGLSCFGLYKKWVIDELSLDSNTLPLEGLSLDMLDNLRFFKLDGAFRSMLLGKLSSESTSESEATGRF